MWKYQALHACTTSMFVFQSMGAWERGYKRCWSIANHDATCVISYCISLVSSLSDSILFCTGNWWINTGLNFYLVIQPCISPANVSTFGYWTFCLSTTPFYSAPCLSRYSLFSISINVCSLCSKCQVLWGCSQLVTYLSKERTTTCLSQEINPNQWVRATVSSVATFFTKSLQQWLRKRENVPSNQIAEVLNSASWLVHTVDALAARSCKMQYW